MTERQCGQITRERLGRWAKQIFPNCATPVLLLSVGHGEHSGELHLCATDDTSDEHILHFLEFAQVQIAARLAGNVGVGNAKVVLPTDGKDGAK